MTATAAPPAAADLWTDFVGRLPQSARSIARSNKNTAAVAAAFHRGWRGSLIDFVTAGINDADNPAGYVAHRLALAASRDPVKRPAEAEVVTPPRPRAPMWGPCSGNGVDTIGCGARTSVRTRERHCCVGCL